MELIHKIDDNVLNFIQEHLKNSFMDTIMPVITSLGNSGIVWILITIVLIAIKRYRKYGYMLALALIITLVVGNITLKPLVARIRPFDANDLKNILLIEAPTDYSFPSGHTMSSFAAAIVLIYMDKKIGIIAMILAVLIAFSRLYLYVHYPSDVLAGMILGFLSAIISIKLLSKIKV